MTTLVRRALAEVCTVPSASNSKPAVDVAIRQIIRSEVPGLSPPPTLHAPSCGKATPLKTSRKPLQWCLCIVSYKHDASGKILHFTGTYE